MQFSILTSSGLRGAPGYSLDQAHHLPIEMDPLIGMLTYPLLSVIKHHEQGKSELVLACASRGRVPPDLEAWEQAAGQEAEGSGLQSNARQREQTASAERQLLLKASVHRQRGQVSGRRACPWGPLWLTRLSVRTSSFVSENSGVTHSDSSIQMASNCHKGLCQLHTHPGKLCYQTIICGLFWMS